jgi:hypothetical protein
VFTTLIGILIFVADIWAVVNVLKSSESGAAKLLWTLLIILLPLMGLIIWFFAGPRGR